MRLLLGLVCVSLAWAQKPVFVEQASGTDASLRGLSVVNAGVAWAGGTKGTLLRTVDGGAHWEKLTIRGTAELDFRDVEGVSASTAYAMSAGPGDKSKLFRTDDGGRSWRLLLANAEAAGFWDAIAFWDRDHGLLMGDPVGGEFTILRTSDGGRTWQRMKTPASIAGEGGFAASGTCLVVGKGGRAWYASGGRHGSRVFRSEDRGNTWTVVQTPVRNDGKAAGIFSLAFAGLMGMAVGGDFQKPEERAGSAALTTDGGRTWTAVGAGGYRSGVAMLPGGKRLVAVGSHGTSWSADGGRTWEVLGSTGYHAVALTKDGEGWAVGAGGRIARVKMP